MNDNKLPHRVEHAKNIIFKKLSRKSKNIKLFLASVGFWTYKVPNYIIFADLRVWPT